MRSLLVESRWMDGGVILGMMAQAWLYLKGVGVEVNVTRTLELCTSLQNKHPEAGFLLGDLILGLQQPATPQPNLKIGVSYPR